MAHTVLIAEDDADLRRLLYRMFQNEGYDVLAARDGRDAHRLLLENGLPDVMVVDHNMPGKTGLDLLKEVRHREKERRVVAILITATHMRGSDDVKAARDYADMMMGKPFDYRQLMGIVNGLLNQRN